MRKIRGDKLGEVVRCEVLTMYAHRHLAFLADAE